MAAFLARRIGFLGIARTVGQVLERWPGAACDDLEAVMAYDTDARRLAAEIVAATGFGVPRLKDPQSPMLATITQYLVPFLLVLSVVVFVHEFGHYYVARRNGVRIEVFSIGFGPELFGRNDRHGTRWKFSAVPLGGYVKMLGDADAASATVDPRHATEPDSFPAKSVWQRMAIVVAGPMANFLFAIVTLAILFAVGRPAVHPAGGRHRAARQPGGGRRAGAGRPDHRGRRSSHRQLRGSAGGRTRQCRPGRSPSRSTRDGEVQDLVVTPAASEIEDRFGNKQQVGLIGVSRAGVEYRRSNPFLALFEATGETGRMIGGTLYALGPDGGRHARHAGAGRAAADRPDVGRRSRRMGSCRRCGSRPCCRSISA